jgi:hypothetical protein
VLNVPALLHLSVLYFVLVPLVFAVDLIVRIHL